MEYNYETSESDIEVLEEYCKTIKEKTLLKIANSALENFNQISIILALPHFLLTKGVNEVKRLQYLLEGAVATKNRIQPQTEEAKRQLEEFISDKFKQNEKEHSEEGRKVLNELRNKNPFIENAIQVQALNSLVHVWTIFESTSKEIWMYLLNTFQSKFLNNILSSKSDETEGISGKYISINLLGKYDFNINNKLGYILSSKYDFTSCSGIKKAFIDLDKIQKSFFNFLSSKELYQLELIRNLIVHNAGKIDERFLSKFGQSNFSIDERISITKTDFSKYEDAAILSIKQLLEFSNNIYNEILSGK